MSEERLERIESLLERNTLQLQQNTHDIASIRLALGEFRDTMQACSTSIVALNEAQRITNDNVNVLANTVERLATEAALDRAEIRQIWEYLMRQSGNGREH